MSGDPTPSIDDRIADTISALLGRRRDGATICPSEVARELCPDEAGWRALMPRVRTVAKRLVATGALRVTRGGRDVDAESGGGPIRLGR